MEVTKIVLG